MTDFVDPTVIAQITAAKDELVAEVAKISADSDVISAYADSLSNPTIPEAPIDGNTYGRKDGDWAVVDASGGAGAGVWGAITGTLSDQTDLQNALDDKADASSLANVATSGSYNDLTGKPSIIPEAPINGKQYARQDGAWEQVVAEVPANPTFTGGVTIDDNSHKAQIVQDSSYIYLQRPSPFSGQYQFRLRLGDSGLDFSTDTAGTVWNPVGGGAAAPTNLGKTTNATSVTITSSTGDNVTINGASTYSAGVMTADDKDKLNGLQNFSGTHTGNLTVRKNTSSYTVLVPTDGANNTFKTQFQGWSTSSAWGSAAHQYDVNFKADGVYHQNIAGGGAERRLAFADELGGGGGASTAADVSVAATPTNYTAATGDVEAHLAGIDTALANAGGSSPIRSLFVSFGRQYTDNDGNPVSFSSTQNVITNSKTDFTCDAIKTGFNAISPALQVVDWHLKPSASDLSYLPADALANNQVALKIMFSEGTNSPYATLFCHFIDLGSTPNSNNGNVYIRNMRGGAEVHDSGWKLISTSA